MLPPSTLYRIEVTFYIPRNAELVDFFPFCDLCNLRQRQWQIPDFPDVGAPTPEFGAKTYYLPKIFAENCNIMKTKEPVVPPPSTTWICQWRVCLKNLKCPRNKWSITTSNEKIR